MLRAFLSRRWRRQPALKRPHIAFFFVLKDKVCPTNLLTVQENISIYVLFQTKKKGV